MYETDVDEAIAELANKYEWLGRLEDAFALRRALIEAHPRSNDAVTHHMSILVWMARTGDPRRFEAFDQLSAMRAVPGLSRVVVSMLRVLVSRPERLDPQLAERAHRALAEVDGLPHHAVRLGELLVKQRRWPEAIAAYELAIRAQPRYDLQAPAIALIRAHKAQLEAKHGPLLGPWTP